MRRLLLILMLVFWPLQSVWAVAANYCEHEAPAASAHFGHHQHQHLGEEDGGQDSVADTAAQSTSPSAMGQAGADLDGHGCHSLGIALFGAVQAAPMYDTGLQTALFIAPLLRAPSPLRPERPNWPALA